MTQTSANGRLQDTSWSINDQSKFKFILLGIMPVTDS